MNKMLSIKVGLKFAIELQPSNTKKINGAKGSYSLEMVGI